MKVLLFTHEQDIDGIGCVILGKKAFRDFDYVTCKTFEIDKNFKKYLDNKSIYDYDKIYVTDLCLHEPILSIINNDEILRNKVLVLDHHKTEIESNKYEFVNVILKCDKGSASGTSLFYDYLINNSYLVKPNLTLQELVEFTRQYDTWEWEKYDNKKARMLHLILETVGYEKYIDIIMDMVTNRSNGITFNQEELDIINNWEETFKRDSQSIINNMIVYSVDIDREYRIGYVNTPYKYRNDLNELVKQNNVNDVDLIGMFSPDKEAVAYRGVKDMDVSIIPTYFGGKGHKGAGTNPINNEKFQRVLKKVKF